ncbi:MAG: sporulation protein [Acidimicrobiia bacterium]|nr:sporulation protein [Acidimicrobiia bacterium]
MELDTVLEEARSVMGPDRVFGEPHERNGVTVIPAAKIAGGGGGGADESDDGGAGGGFGVRARPAGALVIDEDGSVKWKVPFDINRVILGGQLVGVAFFFFAWLTERSKARAVAKTAIATAAIGPRAG